MNKEECLKAHDNLCKALIKTDYVECVKGYTYQTMEDELEMFYQLINEHFEVIEKHEQLEERYKLLKESYDELLGNAVKLQEGI